jgi:hypothetical protein
VLSLDVCDETNTTRVLFVVRVVETLPDREGTSPRAVVLDVVAVHEVFHDDRMKFRVVQREDAEFTERESKRMENNKYNGEYEYVCKRRGYKCKWYKVC